MKNEKQKEPILFEVASSHEVHFEDRTASDFALRNRLVGPTPTQFDVRSESKRQLGAESSNMNKDIRRAFCGDLAAQKVFAYSFRPLPSWAASLGSAFSRSQVRPLQRDLNLKFYFLLFPKNYKPDSKFEQKNNEIAITEKKLQMFVWKLILTLQQLIL